jgi:hypothetical protein
MATYSTLQTRVGHIVIDLPASVQAQIPTLINEAIREIQRAHNFRVNESTITAVTTLNTRILIAKPSNHLAWRDLPYIIDVDGRVRHLQWAPNKMAVARDFGLTDGGEADNAILDGMPVALLISEPTDELGTENIEVYPLPDGGSLYSDGEYRIRIPYYKYLTALSSGGGQNWFTNNGEQAIAYKAAAMAFFLDWDEERATVWTQLATKELKDLVLLDKKARLSQVKELVPQLNARGSKLGRRDRPY